MRRTGVARTQAALAPWQQEPFLSGSIIARLKAAHADDRLIPAALSWLKTPAYLIHNPAGGHVKLHIPDSVEPDPADVALVERILASYAAMKRDQTNAGTLYQPSSLWQRQLDDAYYPLNSGSLEQAHHFLANFGSWYKFTGITWSTLFHSSARSLLKRRHLENVFLRQQRLWDFYHVGRKPLAELEHPRAGNPSGAFVDGIFMTLQSFSAEVYGSIAAGIARGFDRPVVAELGAGYGPILYYASRQLGDVCFSAFDLPETLCLAAYFQIKANPGKRALLYGEEPYAPDAHGRFDLIFMPSHEMEKLGRDSVDLFLNSSSLGEMTPAAASNYVRLIADASLYFLPLNHDRVRNRFSDGETSLLGHEYPVPLDRFALLYRYPDLFHMTNRGFLDFGSETFAYLYGRIASET